MTTATDPERAAIQTLFDLTGRRYGNFLPPAYTWLLRFYFARLKGGENLDDVRRDLVSKAAVADKPVAYLQGMVEKWDEERPAPRGGIKPAQEIATEQQKVTAPLRNASRRVASRRVNW